MQIEIKKPIRNREMQSKPMKKGVLTSFAILAILTAACGNKVYDRYAHTPVAGWEKNDTLSFAVPRVAIAGVYGINVALRTNGAYPFQALTLIVEQHILPAKRMKTDTINCVLTDRDGKAKGQGISYYQYRFHASNLHLSPGDSLFITVRHDMKREVLPGISDIGVIIEN